MRRHGEIISLLAIATTAGAAHAVVENTPGVNAAWATLNGAIPSAEQAAPSAPASAPAAAATTPQAATPAATTPPATTPPASAPSTSAPATPNGTTAGAADPALAPDAPRDRDWPSTIQPDETPKMAVGGGYIHQFSSSIDQGASMSADRFYGSFSARFYENQDLSLMLAMGYEFDWYHWSGNSSLGNAKPFNDVNLFALQLRGTYKLNQEWSISAGGIFGLAGETEADAGSSLYGGGIASVNWTPNKDFLLGLGVLAVTQIEDQPIIIPVPVVHIRFAEEWVLSTMRRPPASPFVGIDVAWEPVNSKVDFAFGIGWQQRRFRLGSNADPLLNNGVGEDQSWAALISLGYDLLPSLRVDLIAGTTFYEKLQLETSSGRVPRDATLSPNALLGAFVTYRF